MTLNLTATTTEEKVLKEYLEQNASEVLADKINNGVLVEKDGKKLISKSAGSLPRRTGRSIPSSFLLRSSSSCSATCPCTAS